MPQTQTATPDAPIRLSIVIPMFNEADNLKHTVDRVAETLRDFRDGAWEIVIVNDGSFDDTWENARKLAAEPGYGFLRIEGYPRNRGRGFALRTGFAAARGEWICSIDADLTYSPDQILKLLDVLREDPQVDLVLASAYMPGGKVEGVPLSRLLPSRIGNTILSWFMRPSGQQLYTITCVFRAYRRHVIESLDLESDGKDIHLEILSKAIMLGYNYREIPATLHARKRGKSKFRFKHTATSHLIFALFERPILIFGFLGVGSLAAGMGILAFFFFRWLYGPPLNPERPLMYIMIILFLGGFQLISFGVLGMQFVNLRKEMIKAQARLLKLDPDRNAPETPSRPPSRPPSRSSE
jgi:glycosyltransferase involved in cell wall biosynthesis